MFQLSVQDIHPGEQAGNKEEAIRQVAAALVQAGNVADGYVNGMLAREQQTSTFLGNGIAIPHGTTDTRDQVLKTGVQVYQFPQGVLWGEGQVAYVAIGIAASGDGRNSSVTISTQKEEIYESKDFASLEPGEFIGMGNRSNIKGHFRKKFRLFELEEEPLPVVAFRTEKEISDNYTRILKDIERVLGMEETEEDVNSLFADR